MLLPEPLDQVDEPPAHHPMPRRDRAVFDPLEQLPTMLIAQDRGRARRLAVQETVGTLSIEPQHPVAHGLQPHTTDPGRLGTAAAIVDRSQRQKPPGLRPILALARQRPQPCCIEIRPKGDRSGHGKLPVCHP